MTIETHKKGTHSIVINGDNRLWYTKECAVHYGEDGVRLKYYELSNKQDLMEALVDAVNQVSMKIKHRQKGQRNKIKCITLPA